MAKTTHVAVATVGDLITAVIAQLVTDGWVQVGTTGIYESFVDAEGRSCYIKIFEDTLGQFMVEVSPKLNDAGTDFPSVATYSLAAGCNFVASQTWELYSTSKSFYLASGNLSNSMKVFAGRQDMLPDVSALMAPYVGFLSGCRLEDSATAYTPLFIRGYQSFFWVCTLQDEMWASCAVSLLNQMNTSTSAWRWAPVDSFLDGKLACHKPLLCATGATGDYSEQWGIVGILPDVLEVLTAPSHLLTGDTVELEDGAIYELQGDLNNYSTYLNAALLWRMN
ncbi:MAG: hypothetical protein GY906_13010 [bacterium]|nr:hypothetical protein [bacterium]